MDISLEAAADLAHGVLCQRTEWLCAHFSVFVRPDESGICVMFDFPSKGGGCLATEVIPSAVLQECKDADELRRIFCLAAGTCLFNALVWEGTPESEYPVSEELPAVTGTKQAEKTE